MGDVIWGTDFRGKAPVGTEIPKAELSHIELMALDVFNFAMTGEPCRTIYESSLGYLPDESA